MRSSRVVLAGALVVVALVLQVAVFPHLAWQGIVPNLCLLVVVAAALVRGPSFGATLGFVAGLLLDLAPPPTTWPGAGRWPSSWSATSPGLMRTEDARPPAISVVSTVAVSSLVGSSVFALTGLLLAGVGWGDGVPGGREPAEVVVVALLWDVALTPFVLPWVMRLFAQLEPASAR